MAEKCARIFTCEECSFMFRKRSHLLRHKLIHSDERPYTCGICEKSFRSSFHLARHTPTHNGVKSFKCDYEGCDVACITEWNLKRHVKRTHLGTFKCDKCNKEFRKNKLLQQHKSSEHKRATVCCEFPGCAQIFSLPSKMRQHLKMHTEKGYICPVKDCHLKFSLWSECRLHASQCKKKEVNCDVCDKVFTERSNLKAHKKIHSEEREVFQCTYDGCGRFYTKQYNLKVHVQSFHLNIRPFVCTKDSCTKRFHFQHLLRKHLEVMHDRNAMNEKVVKKQKKRTRSVRPSLISGITGYIPELWKKMTPEEIHAYVEDEDKSLSGNEGSSTDQFENKTAQFDDEEIVMQSFLKEEGSSEVADTEVIHSSDEFDTITELVEIEPFLYKPVKTIRKSNLNRLKPSLKPSATLVSHQINAGCNIEQDECMEETRQINVDCNVEEDECMEELSEQIEDDCVKECSEQVEQNEKIRHIHSRFSHIESKMGHDECMKIFSARFKHMLGKSPTSNLNIGLCRIQSLESDSSDSDVQNKHVQCVI